MRILLDRIMKNQINRLNRGHIFDAENDELGFNNTWSGMVEQIGQLAIDVYETSDEYVVVSTIAGVSIESLEISMNNDMLTIKGERVKHIDGDHKDERKIKKRMVNYIYQECFWGKFSRSIILPKDIKIEKIKASLENGILKIVLPINRMKKQTIIKVKEK